MFTSVETTRIFPQDAASRQSVTIPIVQNRTDGSGDYLYNNNIAGVSERSDLALVYILEGQVAENWILNKPLLITLEQEEGSYIFSDEQFMVYGVGDTPELAFQDYLSSLIEYFDLISSRRDHDQQTDFTFRHLKQYLHKID